MRSWRGEGGKSESEKTAWRMALELHPYPAPMPQRIQTYISVFFCILSDPFFPSFVPEWSSALGSNLFIYPTTYSGETGL